MQRMQSAATRLRDPRRNRRNESLFEPPHRINSPPKSHNQTMPTVKAIFGDDHEDIMSSDLSSSSSSLGSLPSVEHNQPKNHNSTAFNNDMDMDSLSDSDIDCSFSSFNKRKSNKKQFPPTTEKLNNSRKNDTSKFNISDLS